MMLFKLETHYTDIWYVAASSIEDAINELLEIEEADIKSSEITEITLVSPSVRVRKYEKETS